MRSEHFPHAASACLLALTVLTACGTRDSSNEDADPSAEAPAAGEAAPADAAPATDASAAINLPLTVADIDHWQKGIAGELEAVQAAAAKMKGAKTGEDTLSAMMGVQEMTTISVGAQAAGVDQERYKVIRSNLNAAVSYLTPGLGGIDTTLLLPAQRTELKQMNEAQLKQLEGMVPAEVVAALRPRAEALRKQDLELVGARLKGAGM